MEKLGLLKLLMLCLATCYLTACDEPWNNPYPNYQSSQNTLFRAFSERPKHLDPARSYSAGEWELIGQIYEPPLQYHYLKRPYTLEPAIATKMPQLQWDPQLKKYYYHISIQSNVYYSPHPAFAKDAAQHYYYHNLSEHPKYARYKSLAQFPKTDTRALTAEDFVYQIKRLADPKLNSPIFGFLSLYIEGLSELRETLQVAYADLDPNTRFLDLRKFPLSGVTLEGPYDYKIYLKKPYEQFVYWLAMPFFAPMPWEACAFYQQKTLIEKNITLDWYPIGTGPYQLIENNPERRIILTKNPNFREEFYPSHPLTEDKQRDLQRIAGQRLPFIDTVVYSLEKEAIPFWNKFLQGYYDEAAVNHTNFNSVIDASSQNGIQLSPMMQAKKIQLNISEMPSTMYWAFNMLDKVVGGLEEAPTKLRQAIAIAFDIEEYISIFANHRGIVAHGPIPPGIAGYTTTNPVIYNKISTTNPPAKHSLAEAKRLLEAAGYPNGRDKNTGKPLQLYYDAISSGDPNEKALFAWIQKQFKKLNIELVIRATDYNRFRDKMINGQAQLFSWGWNADYPDPENFLFMFYSKNAKVAHGGENAANYHNPQFDALYEAFSRENSIKTRNSLIEPMVALLQQDVPWIWGYHPQAFSLTHQWNHPTKPNTMARNTLKYKSLDPKIRQAQQKRWNRPILWPFVGLIGIFVLIIAPGWYTYYSFNKQTAKRRH